MALTLAQGNMYTTTELDRKVIDILAKKSRILEILPFEDLKGTSLTYDLIATDATAQFYSVNQEWVESTLVLSQDTVTLKILGGDADIDNFLLTTRSNKMDLKGTVLNNKIKAVKNTFMHNFWYGDTDFNAKAFNGMHDLMTSLTYNVVCEGTADTAGTMTVANLRTAIDLIHGYSPKHMFMTKMARRYISAYLDSVGQHFQRGVDEFGRLIQTFDGLEIVPDEHLLNTEDPGGAGDGDMEGGYKPASNGVGGDTTSIFILSFAPQACSGVQGESGVKTIPIGDLETKDSQRYRIRWYCGLKFEDLRSCAVLSGCDPDTAMTA